MGLEQEEYSFDEALSQVERDVRFETVYERAVPGLDNHAGKLIAAQLMLVLQLEGVIKGRLTDKDIELLESLKERVLEDPQLCKEVTALIGILGGKSL